MYPASQGFIGGRSAGFNLTTKVFLVATLVGLALTIIKDVMKQIRYKQGGTTTYHLYM